MRRRSQAGPANEALIAATAIATGLPVYTTNADDFVGITELDVGALAHPDPPSRL